MKRSTQQSHEEYLIGVAIGAFVQLHGERKMSDSRAGLWRTHVRVDPIGWQLSDAKFGKGRDALTTSPMHIRTHRLWPQVSGDEERGLGVSDCPALRRQFSA